MPAPPTYALGTLYINIPAGCCKHISYHTMSHSVVGGLVLLTECLYTSARQRWCVILRFCKCFSGLVSRAASSGLDALSAYLYAARHVVVKAWGPSFPLSYCHATACCASCTVQSQDLSSLPAVSREADSSLVLCCETSGLSAHTHVRCLFDIRWSFATTCSRALKPLVVRCCVWQQDHSLCKAYPSRC